MLLKYDLKGDRGIDDVLCRSPILAGNRLNSPAQTSKKLGKKGKGIFEILILR